MARSCRLKRETFIRLIDVRKTVGSVVGYRGERTRLHRIVVVQIAEIALRRPVGAVAPIAEPVAEVAVPDARAADAAGVCDLGVAAARRSHHALDVVRVTID
jgi:hypothetical protein